MWSSFYLSGVFSHNLDEVGHGEVHDVVFPRQFQDDVGVQEVVTLEQARREAVVSLKQRATTNKGPDMML